MFLKVWTNLDQVSYRLVSYKKKRVYVICTILNSNTEYPLTFTWIFCTPTLQEFSSCLSLCYTLIYNYNFIRTLRLRFEKNTRPKSEKGTFEIKFKCMSKNPVVEVRAMRLTVVYNKPGLFV